ncbi:MAG: hypothetical protein V4692_16245, partial [Bdellovibrionota bacterium]
DRLALFEDWELFLRMSRGKFRLETIPLRLFRYRAHADQRTYKLSPDSGADVLEKLLTQAESAQFVARSFAPKISDYDKGLTSITEQ